MTQTHIEFNGKKYVQTWDAFISDDGRQYIAYGHEDGDDEKEVRIAWDVTLDNPAECDDESNMCDWDKPISVEYID